jgi:nitrite reductase/ring-hydroxylating ferredoxin subunit
MHPIPRFASILSGTTHLRQTLVSRTVAYSSPTLPILYTRATVAVTVKSGFFTARSASTMAQEYKLKGLTSVSLAEGEMREVEVEGVEGAKVLLTNAAGSVQALGANCTHYGAPLVKGVLTKSGRLTCPWHGGKTESDPLIAYEHRGIGTCGTRSRLIQSRLSLPGFRLSSSRLTYPCSVLQCKDRRCRGCPCSRLPLGVCAL